MTSDETINLLKTISQAVDRLASFENKKEDKKGDTIISEDDKLSSTLSTTEKRRWETMSKILARSIKDIVFPKGEEKVGRPEFKTKEIPDLVLSPTFAKIQDASNKWLKAILGALALLAGIISGAIAEIVKLLKGLKLFLSESKLGKFIKDIFGLMKAKFLELLKVLRETKFIKFIEEFIKIKIIEPLSKFFKPVLNLFGSVKDMIKTKVIVPITKFFETLGRLFKVIEAGKGPLFMMKAFPTFFKFFEDQIRIVLKVFQIGVKVGRLFGKLLGPVLVLFEAVVGLYQAFTDPKLQDKSFLQKIITGLTQGLLNFFDFFEIFGLDLFKFETIRDRIETIFKFFREGKWLQGLQAIQDQLLSVVISIPGKIVGWIVGWFDKELGQKIMQFFDKFDLGKFRQAIFKRIGKIFGIIKDFFSSIEEKLGPVVGFLLKALGGPVYLAFIAFKKAFEYAVPLMKGIGSIVSKVFGYIKSFFVFIFDGIKKVAKKISGIISKIPGMGDLSNELKAIANESMISETSAQVYATVPPEKIMEVSGQENIAKKFDNISSFAENTQDSFSQFDDIISTREDNTNEAFSMFGDQVESLNKTGFTTNKIAVDQLREFKTLNQKFDMLIEQLANSRNVVNNVLTQNSVNSFPQSTSVFDLRRSHRESD